MTKQQKIQRLEKAGKKVVFTFTGKVFVGDRSFESVSAAHRYYYGY